MDELDSLCVERLPREHDFVATVLGAAQLLACNFGSASVELVAQDRTADMREMNTNLMRPSGLGQHLHGRKATESLDDFIEGRRLAARRVPRANGHLFPLLRMQTDRLLDKIAIAVRNAGGDGKIFLLRGAGLELG